MPIEARRLPTKRSTGLGPRYGSQDAWTCGYAAGYASAGRASEGEVGVTLGVIIIVTVLLVLGFGILIFRLMRRSQTVVPDVADRDAASRDRVVEVDERGHRITEAQDPRSPAHDDAAFEDLLKDEIHDLGREQTAADDD